jgi:hypothetical protein
MNFAVTAQHEYNHYLHNYTNPCVITQINYTGVIRKGIVADLVGGGYDG